MLMDKVYICSYVFVIAGLSVVVYTSRMVKLGAEAAAVVLHRRSLVLLTSLYFVCTSALIALAIREG